MPKKTSGQLIQEVHQAMFGVEGTEDRGIVGDVRETRKDVKEQNKRVGKAEAKINKIWGVLIGIGAVGGTGLGLGINQLIGG